MVVMVEVKAGEDGLEEDDRSGLTERKRSNCTRIKDD
jgi:hypothetical protein